MTKHTPDILAIARAFVAPYAGISDATLRDIAAHFPDEPSRLHVIMKMSVTARSAQAILDFRAAIAKAAPSTPAT